MSTFSDIDELIERYYDADLSEQEEQALLDLLFGPYADDHRYDEHRAVMSYTAVGKRLASNRRSVTSSRTFRFADYKHAIASVASVAACMVLAFNCGLFSKADQNDLFMVRHGDVCYNSEEMAESEMKLTLASVLEGCPSVEDELSNVFADINN